MELLKTLSSFPLCGSTGSMRASPKLVSFTHPSLNLSHPTPEAFVWNTLIRAHVQSKVPIHSPISIFNRMRLHGVEPDNRTFPFLLQFFKSIPYFQSGKRIHAQVFLFGYDQDPFVQTSLIHMYSACGNLMLARQVFDEITQPDLPSWNSIIDA
ncbi:hypothetical protein ABKV19_018592 [Rosa sericea]